MASMSADAIARCNKEWFSSGKRTKIDTLDCVVCAELSYVARKAGENCPTCHRDLTAKELLPRLCVHCKWMLFTYSRWLLRRRSGDESPTASHSLCHWTDTGSPLSDMAHATLSCADCELCRLLKLEGKPSRKAVITSNESDVRFTDEGINILGTPYSVTFLTQLSHSHDPLVPWTEIRKWIALCDIRSGPSATELQIQTLLSLDPWLVDVDDHCLVSMSEAKDTVYAALSYVWGEPQPMLLDDNKERTREGGALDQPNACSQTIRDAMLVCRRTGVRYLWVDALCIQQDALPEEKLKQIDNMDSIYANAYFTIVAADSTSARQGIHGVSIRRNSPEPFAFYFRTNESVDVRNASLSISSAETLASSTKWATRAWTYQEALLSRRLLVFTEELCFLIHSRGVVGREDKILEQDVRRLNDFHHNSHLRPLRQNSPEFKTLANFYDVVSTYSARDLTCPDDIVRAFSGIMTAMQEQLGEIRYGMPLRDLNYALAWKHHGLDPSSTASRRQTNLDSVRHPSGQREGFPTWSWAGWLHDGGKVHFPARTLTVKAAIYYIDDLGDFATTGNFSEPEEPKAVESSNILKSLSYPLTEEEQQDTRDTLTGLDLPSDSLVVLKTVVLRIRIDHVPTETNGDWGIYVHNFEKGKQPAPVGASPLDDPYRSVIHVPRHWMDSEDNELEFAILGADTSDPKTLHLETVLLDRSGSLSYRVGATDLRFKVLGEDSMEETLARIVKENAVEIIILA